jgi:guanylate kinase
MVYEQVGAKIPVTSSQSSKGQLFVVAAPSGAGKTSLVKALIHAMPSIEVAVSHTTRQRRPDEVDGVNYHFIDKAGFKKLQSNDAFIESAQVFSNLYGTSRQSIDKISATGRHTILEIDWQGAAQIRQRDPASIHIFILPPSLQALGARLLGRGQDDSDTIEQRMNEAVSEMSHYQEFDYLVINDNFDTALEDLRRIVKGLGEDLRVTAQYARHPVLIDALTS